MIDLRSVQNLACCDRALSRATRGSVGRPSMIDVYFEQPSMRAGQPYDERTRLLAPPTSPPWNAPACLADRASFAPYLQRTHKWLEEIREVFTAAYREPQSPAQNAADALACLPYLDSLPGWLTRMASEAPPGLVEGVMTELMDNGYTNPIALEFCLQSLHITCGQQLPQPIATKFCQLGARYIDNIPLGGEALVPNTLRLSCSFVDFLPNLRPVSASEASSSARLLAKLIKIGALPRHETRQALSGQLQVVMAEQAPGASWWPAALWRQPSDVSRLKHVLEYDIEAFDRSLEGA